MRSFVVLGKVLWPTIVGLLRLSYVCAWSFFIDVFTHTLNIYTCAVFLLHSTHLSITHVSYGKMIRANDRPMHSMRNTTIVRKRNILKDIRIGFNHYEFIRVLNSIPKQKNPNQPTLLGVFKTQWIILTITTVRPSIVASCRLVIRCWPLTTYSGDRSSYECYRVCVRLTTCLYTLLDHITNRWARTS